MKRHIYVLLFLVIIIVSGCNTTNKHNIRNSNFQKTSNNMNKIIFKKNNFPFLAEFEVVKIKNLYKLIKLIENGTIKTSSLERKIFYFEDPVGSENEKYSMDDDTFFQCIQITAQEDLSTDDLKLQRNEALYINYNLKINVVVSWFNDLPLAGQKLNAHVLVYGEVCQYINNNNAQRTAIGFFHYPALELSE